MKSRLHTIPEFGRRGNAMLETALASTLMFLMLSGVIDYGRAYYFTDKAASAARAGAQYGIESAANFGNYAGMSAAARTDAGAWCEDANGGTVSCTTGTPQAYIAPHLQFSVNATSFCKDASGTAVACTASGARGFVSVATSISYPVLLPWPGLPKNLQIGGQAIMRCQ